MSDIKLKITVPKEVIESCKDWCGIYPNGSEACPIAIEIKKIFPLARVGFSCIIPFYPEKIAVNLPSKPIAFIRKFDRFTPTQRMTMPGFEFEITLTEEVIERIDISEVTKVLNSSENLKAIK